MFKSNLQLAIRHLTKHKLFSLINILCLAIGITFTLLIAEYIITEKAVNKTIKDYKDQYVIKSKWKQENMGLDITTFEPLAKAVKDRYPTLVDNYCRFNLFSAPVSVDDRHFNEFIFIGDTTIVTMFGFPLLYGDKDHAFRDGQSAIVTESFAIKYFNRKDVIGKVITVQTPADGQKHVFAISAVLKDLPVNSVTQFVKGVSDNLFLPIESNAYFQKGDRGDKWTNIYNINIIKLHQGVDPARLESPLNQTISLNVPDNLKKNVTPVLAGLEDYYLKADNGSIQKMIATLTYVTAFILLLVIINFVNIKIGTSSYRVKEIGLRKVFGSTRYQLIVLNITESVVLTFVTGIISLGFYELLLPFFSDLLSATLADFWHFSVGELLLYLLFLLVIGITAGLYPAFALSATNTVLSIKGKIGSARNSLILRKSLVVIQFTLAIATFISAIYVSKQLSYFFNKDLGFQKDQLLVISSLPRTWDSTGVTRMEAARQQLMQVAGVDDATLSYDIPDGKYFSNLKIVPSGANDNQAITVTKIIADAQYASTYKLQMKEGSFFDPGSHMKGMVVINESAQKALGWESAVGKPLRILASPLRFPPIVGGVVKDFNYKSLQSAIQPLIIVDVNDEWGYRYLSLKITSADDSSTVRHLEAKWRTLFPSAPFEYAFMDDKFRTIYSTEIQLQKATVITTTLNLIIVFLGIFGIIAFTLTKRTREIAMRKILGADTQKIIFLFLKDYAALILIANIIAWPLAYIIVHSWLDNYVYKVTIDLSPFLLIGVGSFLAAFILITVQCFKVASASPIKGIRSE